MFKLVIVVTTLVYYTYALGVVPLELSSSFSEITSRKEPSTSTEYLLPRDTTPFRYDVHITTDIDKGIFDFTGIVEIYITAAEAVNKIVLHHRQLIIDEIKLYEVDGDLTTGTELTLDPHQYDDIKEFLTIPLSGTDVLVVAQKYKLVINYQGTLRGRKASPADSDAGFYRSSYTNADGVEKWLATTQFESTDARHGFPCYDEPALKAKFNIQLKHDLSYTAISNMPQKTSVREGTYRTTTFEETPLMSTYLIAFVVSDFVPIANTPAAGEVSHRVFGTPARVSELDFTLEAGEKILKALDEYLNVKYYDTIPKMDQIGIPDFAAGAMENWGLVTYAESAFYFSPSSPHNQKDRISKIVAHEFAHQWFGNLVSPEWWSYIWLNEGFATVFEYLIANIVYPEYQAVDYFTIQACQRVLITDSVSDSRPMTFAAYTPSEISSLFDRIAYDKSGCVISMMMHAIGESTFKAGINQYLTQRKENAATPGHLFSALQYAAAATLPPTINIINAFGGWSTQRGYPILHVDFDAATKVITLKQEAFLIDADTDPVTKLTWTIPFNFITNEELSSANFDDTTTYDWLDVESKTITPTVATNLADAEWVLFNKKLTGYYRVNYNTVNWDAIISYVANSADAQKIHHLNRAQLIGDALNIARAAQLNYDIPLRLAQNMMKHETNYFVWTPFINDFNFLEQTVFETASYEKLLKLAIEVGTHAYNHYTIDESDDDEYYDTITRFNIVNFMCRVGYTKCLEDTNAALVTYLADTAASQISSYLKPAILQNGLRIADSALFSQVFELAMATPTNADRTTFIAGLGLTNSEENIDNLLGSVLTENNQQYNGATITYSTSERNTILTTIASSKLSGFSRIVEFLTTESVAVKKIFGNDIVTVFSTLASRTSTDETLDQLKELMTLYQDNDVQTRFAGYTATAQQNIDWNEKTGSYLKSALDEIYVDGVTVYRLPGDTVPLRYDVQITTDIDQGLFEFTGEVQIYLQAKSDVDRIVIHHRQLTIESTRLIAVNDLFVETGLSIPLKTLTYNATNEFLTIPLNVGQLTKDNLYKLDIAYKGTLRGTKATPRNSNAGFYRSSYTTPTGVVKWLATTQFESTDARHGFPCYDEPALKAKFNIQLKHGQSYTAISNMPQKTSVPDGTYQITTFEETPLMSTYLIAFVVSDFESIANTPAAGEVSHRVFGTPHRTNELDFTLEAGEKILKALDEYLNVKYYDTIPKMDQIAIPDFAAGAMENWGLVTYAESAFYLSPSSPHNQKDRISKIVAHEFGHQWFGNLVSPEWWNYIWLNEGFATVFEFLIPNKVYPEYKALDYFTIQVCHRVMITDSRSTIRPMTSDASSPNEISSLFDSIAYDKSGCVITMMMHAIGEETFKAGLTTYLTERNQKEANSGHLFSALQSVAAATLPATININTAFGGWSTQRGYPILNVEFDATTKVITLKQEAFLSDAVTDPGTKLTWTIPFNFITNEELSDDNNEDTTTYDWLAVESKTITPTVATNLADAEWVLFNKKLTGYYRVNYNTDNWNAITSFVANVEDAQKIHHLNRAQLIGDAMNIARANRLSYGVPLRLAQNIMKHEISYFIWTPFISDFNFLEQIIFDTTSYPKLLKLAVEVGAHAYNHYTIDESDDDEHYDTIIRNSLINFMCRVGYSKCHEDTTAGLISYLEDPTTVPAYLKTTILQNGLRNADTALFSQVFELVMATPTNSDRSTFLAALGLTNSEENIDYLLGSVLTENNEKYNDVTITYSTSERNTILTTIASSKVSGFEKVLEFLKTEEEDIKTIFGNNIVTVFSTLASRTSTDETLNQLKELMALYQNTAVQNSFATYTATANANIAWNKGAGATIKGPIDEMYEDDGTTSGPNTTPNDDGAANTIIISATLVTLALFFTRLMA